MTLTELLKANGIEDDVISKITAAMKENKIFTSSEENLDIRYGKLKDEHSGKLKELDEANNLIAELKKSTKGSDELQGKIAVYEKQVDELQQKLTETKINSAIKVALLSEKANDVDYLTYKLNEKIKENGETLQLDENENVKGLTDKLAALKTQYPSQFGSSETKGAPEKKFEPNKLPETEEKDKKLTKNDIFKMPYQERAKFQQENPTEYSTIMNS